MSDIVKSIGQKTGLDPVTLRRIISNAPERYKVYPIKKRNSIEKRWIAQPSRELKLIQRALEDIYLRHLPIHDSAMAYVPGRSIKINAERHITNGAILKLDFKDFFPSIRSKDWMLFCSSNGIFQDETDRQISSRILFRRDKVRRSHCLSIGAPTSPAISNLLMFSFDEIVSNFCNSEHVTYTRYADDLTFSARRTGYLTRVEEFVRKTLRSLEYPKIYLNDEKKVLATKKFRRSVTGINITNDNKLSVGREVKRLVRAKIHHFSFNEMDPKEAEKLAGQVAFIDHVEHGYVEKIRVQFGDELIDRLRATQRDRSA